MKTWWRQRDRRVHHVMNFVLFTQFAIAVGGALPLIALLSGVVK
jgi:hypothetical protein